MQFYHLVFPLQAWLRLLDTTANAIYANRVLQTKWKNYQMILQIQFLFACTAEDGSKSRFYSPVNNTGYYILGSAGAVNVTGLGASDALLKCFMIQVEILLSHLIIIQRSVRYFE